MHVFQCQNVEQTVEEDITNTNPLGRVWNLVQHPTLGPPFLDEVMMLLLLELSLGDVEKMCNLPLLCLDFRFKMCGQMCNHSFA